MKFTAEDIITEDFDGNIFEYLELDDKENKKIGIEIEPYEVKGFFGTKTKYRLFIKEFDEDEEKLIELGKATMIIEYAKKNGINVDKKVEDKNASS